MQKVCVCSHAHACLYVAFWLNLCFSSPLESFPCVHFLCQIPEPNHSGSLKYLYHQSCVPRTQERGRARIQILTKHLCQLNCHVYCVFTKKPSTVQGICNVRSIIWVYEATESPLISLPSFQPPFILSGCIFSCYEKAICLVLRFSRTPFNNE